MRDHGVVAGAHRVQHCRLLILHRYVPDAILVDYAPEGLPAFSSTTVLSVIHKDAPVAYSVGLCSQFFDAEPPRRLHPLTQVALGSRAFADVLFVGIHTRTLLFHNLLGHAVQFDVAQLLSIHLDGGVSRRTRKVVRKDNFLARLALKCILLKIYVVFDEVGVSLHHADLVHLTLMHHLSSFRHLHSFTLYARDTALP